MNEKQETNIQKYIKTVNKYQKWKQNLGCASIILIKPNLHTKQ